MKYVVANWKMNLSVAESGALATEILQAVTGWPVLPEIILCPSSSALSEVQQVLAGSGLKLGAQNAGIAKAGAFTGELGIAQLEDLNCEYAILGHSERRLQFHEDDALVRERLTAVFGSQITPIVCVGESLAVREAGQAEAFVTRQLDSALAGQAIAKDRLIMIAYEPVWAIGSGTPATPEQASQVHAVIRDHCVVKLGLAPSQVVVLYGGSVNGENAAEFLQAPGVDGLLVGGASLKLVDFVKVVAAAVSEV